MILPTLLMLGVVGAFVGAGARRRPPNTLRTLDLSALRTPLTPTVDPEARPSRRHRRS